MLDAFIIEELRRRERERNKQADDNRIELPVPEAGNRKPLRPERRPHDDTGSSYEMPSDGPRESNVIDFTL